MRALNSNGKITKKQREQYIKKNNNNNSTYISCQTTQAQEETNGQIVVEIHCSNSGKLSVGYRGRLRMPGTETTANDLK